ncbi:hypothetical protein FB451DRAFT_1215592, partial [Mycena latifolia]
LASRCKNHYQRPCARHQRIGFHRSATTTKPGMGNEHANVPDGHFTDQRHFGFFFGRWNTPAVGLAVNVRSVASFDVDPGSFWMRFRYRRLWGGFCYIASRDPYRFHPSLYVCFLFSVMFSPYSVMKWRLRRSVVAYSWRAGPAFWRIFLTSSFSPSTHSPCPLA